MPKLQYSRTNENIYAVKSGLNPKGGDNIYSIFGSGDIPFMCIERGAKVLGIDIQDSQLDYGKKRIKYLKNGDTESFRNLKQRGGCFNINFDLRNKYFEKINHKELNNNLRGLEILLGDFFNLESDLEVEVDYNSFNKVYASNAFDYIIDRSKGISEKDMGLKFNSFFEKFKSGTLFYVTSFYDSNFKLMDSVFRRNDISNFLTDMDDSWNVSILEKI